MEREVGIPVVGVDVVGRLPDRLVGGVVGLAVVGDDGGGCRGEDGCAAVTGQWAHPFDLQSVFAECAGLVEAHDIEPGQCFHRIGVADQYVLAAEFACRGQLRQGRDKGQPLRHRGHADRDRTGDCRPKGRAPHHAQQPDQSAAAESPGQCAAGDPGQLVMQTDASSCLGRHSDCTPHLSPVADRGDDCEAGSGNDRAAGVDHAGPLCQGSARHRIGLLWHRQRLTGQPRLVDLDVVSLDEPGVGGHHLAGANLDDVAGTQRCGGHVLADGVLDWSDPASGRRILHHQQAAQRAFGMQLLLGRQRGVGEQDAADQRRVQRRAEQGAGHCAGGQDRGDRVGEVGPELRGEIAGQGPGAGRRPPDEARRGRQDRRGPCGRLG